MNARESLLPQHWFRKADADVQTVEILLAHGGNMEMAAMHIQQAVEKYLKGYLLSTGWELDRIHDLPALLDEAVTRNAAFDQFREFCETVNAFYFEARYPFEVEPPPEQEVRNFLEQSKQFIEFILAEIPSSQQQLKNSDEGETVE
ncbi:MAG: HEPN domain-containing protein [candidate division KSB1 bacterium]|nr:HEPN domain-containing protein [candidate division KSB1 bacterium]MDZ7301144.1 HEPN domain-containing protein [candidate division KSB1 bacterium]MDZ7311972.1 HEPN domain-containing protein [candidate division KSB1 bacterium]